MARTRTTRPSLRLALTALFALSLLVGALTATIPGGRTTSAVLADDDEGGDIDEDDNKGKGNDDDGVDEGNPGKGDGKDKEKKGKEDDETELVTAVSTATAASTSTSAPDQAQPTQTTQPALTFVSSPTQPVSSPMTTGTLAVSLRVCPTGVDATGGTDALAAACVDGRSDAVFELAGRTGLYAGWRRDLTTTAAGTARATRLAGGTYALTLDDLDWCAAEASNVADGLIVVEPGETTEVTAYLCGDPAVR